MWKLHYKHVKILTEVLKNFEHNVRWETEKCNTAECIFWGSSVSMQ